MVGSGDFEIQLCFQQRHKYKAFHCSVIFSNVSNCWALETDILCTRKKQTKAREARIWMYHLLTVQKVKKDRSCFSNGFASNAPFIFLLQDLQFSPPLSLSAVGNCTVPSTPSHLAHQYLSSFPSSQ